MGNHRQTITPRLIADLAIFFSLLLLPWWITLVLAVCAAFYFELFYEILFFGLLADSLYRATGAGHLHTELSMILGALALFFTAFIVRKRLSFFDR